MTRIIRPSWLRRWEKRLQDWGMVLIVAAAMSLLVAVFINLWVFHNA